MVIKSREIELISTIDILNSLIYMRMKIKNKWYYSSLYLASRESDFLQ